MNAEQIAATLAGQMTAFRVFSGWDSRQAEAAEVFAYSVRQNASILVNVTIVGLDRTIFSRTGITQFTYTRFLVPWLCEYEGRALFADGADMLCLGDVRELAEFDMQGKAIAVVKHPSVNGRRPRSWSSLMLLNCAKLPGWTPAFIEQAPDDLLMRFTAWDDHELASLPPEWNWLVTDDMEQGQPIKMLHWSYLSDPEGGSWIDRSGSPEWAEWRERWRASHGRRMLGE